MLVVYHLKKKRTTWDEFITDEGFGSINSRRRVGRLKKQNVQEEQTSSIPMPNSSQAAQSIPSMSRQTRSSAKRAITEPFTPIPMA